MLQMWSITKASLTIPNDNPGSILFSLGNSYFPNKTSIISVASCTGKRAVSEEIVEKREAVVSD